MRKRNPQNSLEQSPAFDEIPDHRIAQPFNRFGLDIIGGLFITTSVITLIGLWNWTHGSLIDWWITAIRRLFGSGAYFVVLTLLAFGIDSLHVSVDGQRKIKLTRILQLEAMAFCLLPLLSIYHGHALDYAILGKGGGIIGWGLAELLLLILPKLA
ncbi:MAG: hypothetical protein JW750_07790, partial [Anaerolineaceae bacterium]|nr:hypothetical protein [Anaerolineaceae bacterium]